MNFRKDINGLRALAIIAVLLFHFNPSWLRGGFAGVDVFFVISGFLMTGIIYRGLNSNNFSIIAFYVARANRIIPALFTVCFSLLIFGWFYFLPLNYELLAKHVVSTIGFFSNFIYWGEAGYFDVDSQSKWLLHSWSLSVEWQFYMIYPIILVSLNNFISVANIKRFLIVATIASFIASIYLTYTSPYFAYFSLPTRAWEMMIGGIAYLYPYKAKEKTQKFLHWLGLILILIAYIFMPKNPVWPGYLAVIPVIGTYLVIIANSRSFLINNILMQKIGLWSYSIYLWHWPVARFGKFFEISYWPWVGILISILLGFLSYRLVESIQFSKLCNVSFTSIIRVKSLWMMIFLALSSVIIINDNGFGSEARNKIYDRDIVKKKLAPNTGLNSICDTRFTLDEHCRTSENPEILVFGNSFAMHLIPGILASNPEVKLIQLTKSGCEPIFGLSGIYEGTGTDDCLNFTKQVWEWVSNNHDSIKYVVISSPFNIYNPTARFRLDDGREMVDRELVKNRFNETLDKFRQLGIKPVIVSPPPRNAQNLGECLDKALFSNYSLSQCDFNKASIVNDQKEIYKWMTDLSMANKVIRLDDIICDNNICKTSLDDNFIYRDEVHLSYEGSVEIGKKISFYNLIVD